MKKQIWRSGAAFLLCSALLLSGCQKGPAQEDTATPTPTAQASSFYQNVVESDTRPIAIMIDNDNKSSWPHAGLSDAYLMYEAMVEGGATRIMALFKNATTEKIGPVRSSRHYFLDWVMENDANYVHSGWSPKAESDIGDLGINNINGILGTDSAAYWREEKYKGDYHSLFTSMEKINAMIGTKGYPTTSEVRNINFVKNEVELTDASAANHITIPYTQGFYQVDYSYNTDTKTYDRSMNQSPHQLQEDKVLSPKNIIIQFAKNYSLGDGTARQNVETTSGGDGYYFTNGKYIKITWSKVSRRDKTIYKDESGKEIMINPGQTMIQIVPPTANVTIE